MGQVVAVVRFPVESWWGDGPQVLDVRGEPDHVRWFRYAADSLGVDELVLGGRLGSDPTDLRGCFGFELAGCRVLFRGRMRVSGHGEDTDEWFDVESVAVVAPSTACPGCGWLHGVADCPEIGGG